MDYDLPQQAVAQRLGAQTHDYGAAVPSTAARESTMQRLITRVETITKGLHEIGHRLREHADAVHGTVPEADTAEANGRSCRPGQIGILEDALDRLSEAEAFVAAQAVRNCTLA